MELFHQYVKKNRNRIQYIQNGHDLQFMRLGDYPTFFNKYKVIKVDEFYGQTRVVIEPWFYHTHYYLNT